MDEKREQLLVWPLRATTAAKTALRMSAAASGSAAAAMRKKRTGFAVVIFNRFTTWFGPPLS